MICKSTVWILLITTVFLSCVIEDKSNSTTVKFSHPNTEFLSEEADSVLVYLLYESGDSQFVYKGRKTEGPWQVEVKKEDLSLVIEHYADGKPFGTFSYAYDYSKSSFNIKPKIELYPRTLLFELGDSPREINIKIFPSSLTQEALFESSDESVVEVTKKGIATPTGVGEALITAFYPGMMPDTLRCYVADTAHSEIIPVITRQPKSLDATTGESFRFDVEAEGDNLEFQWYQNQVPVDGEDAVLHRDSMTVEMDGYEYYVIVFNSAGADTSQKATVSFSEKIIPPEILEFPGDTQLVEGSRLELKASVRGSFLEFQWQENEEDMEGENSPTLKWDSLSTNMDGNSYRMIVKNELGADTSTLAVLSVLNSPEKLAIVKTPESGSVNEGSKFTLNVEAEGEGVLKYQWYLNGVAIEGATSDSYISPKLTSEDEGNVYTVRVSNSKEEITSKAAVATVLKKPRITAEPSSQTADTGDSVVFSVKATGHPPLKFQWRKNGQEIEGATDSLYVTAKLKLSDNEAEYDVWVSNSVGEVLSQKALLKVNETGSLPVIREQTDSVTVMEGENALLYVTAEGEDLNFQWKVGEEVLEGQNSSALNISKTPYDLNGNLYVCEVSNNTGSVESKPIKLTVRLYPPKITLHPKDSALLKSNSLELSVVAEGTALSYQWRLNGEDLDGENTSKLSISKVDSAHMGYYDVIVRNNAGADSSDSAQLEVLFPPEILSFYQDPYVHEGKAAKFQIEIQGTDPLSYQWFKDGDSLQGESSNILLLDSVPANYNGSQFKVLVSNEFGQIETSPANLEVRALPVITEQPEAQPRVEGQVANFSVEAGGFAPLSYQWRLNGENIPGASESFYSTPTLTLLENGNLYDVVVSNEVGEVTSDEALLSVEKLLQAPVILTQPENQTVDELGLATFFLTASGDDLEYQWFENNLSLEGETASLLRLEDVPFDKNNNRYFCLVTNSEGSVYSDTVNLTVDLNPPQITSPPQSLTRAEGGNAEFSVTATGSQLSYQWLKDDEILEGLTGATLSLTNISVSDGGDYQVEVSNPAGSVLSQSARLTVQTYVQVSIHPQDKTSDEGSSATFSLTASGTGPLIYEWYVEGNIVDGANSSSLTLENLLFSQNGSEVYCVVSNVLGEVTSDTARLTVNLLPPVITSNPASDSIAVGEDASFSVTAVGTNLSYQWRVNGENIPGATGSTYSMNNVPTTAAGNYSVLVSNGAGSVGSTNARLTVSTYVNITTHPRGAVWIPIAEPPPTIVLSVEATGTRPFSYQWYRDNVAIPGATDSTISITSVPSNTSWAFKVVVSNVLGSMESDTARVTWFCPPNPNGCPN